MPTTARLVSLRGLSLALLIPLALITASASAQLAVPAELHGWEPWVLHGHERHQCPWLVPGKAVDDNRVCAWPAALELEADAHGGRFNQRWEVATEGWLALPGDAEHWPESVSLDGKPATLVARDRRPVLRVAAGTHLVTGTFSWERRPEQLAVPDSIALVALTLDGARVAVPQRDATGLVLGAQPNARQDNRLELRVYRLLDDQLPAMLKTQIHFAVAGEAREVRLPQALPAGFLPTAIDGDLAARLDPDDTLRVQVRPGEFDVTLEARGPSPVSEVRLGARPAPWPAQEVWSFADEERLRVVSVEGVQATDPGQANVPDEWREHPAYRMNPDSVLRVLERSRGLAAQDANELHLERTAWLDFAGGGYTVVDRLRGELRQGWRLELAAPYALESVRTEAGHPLLVTSGMSSGYNGVEVRDANLDVLAVSRLPRSAGAHPASGWHERLTSVSGMLVLGPGYRLLAALGPDAAPQAWLERWRLLDIFAALLIATVAWRLFGLPIAALALGAIVLTHQESGAVTWLWLNLLIALALLRAAPEGWLRRWAGAYRLIALAALVLALVPFAVTQARFALYPQLESELSEPGAVLMRPISADEGTPLRRAAPPPLAAAPAVAAPVEEKEAYAGSVGSVASLGKAVQEVVVTEARGRAPSESYEPGETLQAGPGLPVWRYHAYHYSWSGPVEPAATVRFLISPPWLTRLWRLVAIALSAWLLLVLARGSRLSLPPWLRRAPLAQAAAPLLVLTLTLGALPGARAAATPDPALLTQLQARLLEPPRCAPDCADLLAAEVSVAGARLAVTLTVSALDRLGLALPGADPNWAPDQVQVDGAPAGWVYRGERGTRYVSLTAGRHVVRLEGPTAGVDAVALAFPLAPHVITVSAPGWDVSGINARRLVSGALELVRRREAATGASRQEEFPSFVVVTRTFVLGHDWRIDTELGRVAPQSSAFTVRLPLLAQESVTTPGLEAREHTVTVGLAAGEDGTGFSSIIPVSDSLELVAAGDGAYTEHWQFEVAPTWHVDFSGVPAVSPEENSRALFDYYPRPGEQLKLTVTRPSAVAGGTLALDAVHLTSDVGKRTRDTSLYIDYRSTQGGRQVLRLPPGAEVTRVTSDGTPLALRPEKDELSLSALPGTHRWGIAWRSSDGTGLLTRSPAVVLNAAASNLNIALHLPQDRWVLYAYGPGAGPAILYWGELLVFAAVAWLLGRSRLTTLPTRDWLLLGLGLSTFSWSVFVLFVAFVAVFEWRARTGAPRSARRFNLLQVALALLGVLAVLTVVSAVPRGLLAHPDMHFAGQAGPDGTPLYWFLDQTQDALPRPGIVSVSLWWYKIAMLAWALWLSFALMRWIKWAWSVFARDGLWRARPARTPPPVVAPAPAAPSA
jgi:hypothetical protein